MTEMLSHGVTLMLADVEVLTDVTIVATSSTAALCTYDVITFTDSDADAVQPMTHLLIAGPTLIQFVRTKDSAIGNDDENNAFAQTTSNAPDGRT